MPRKPATPGKYRANRVKLLREREGWTDEELAAKLGWPTSKISKIENRQQDLRLTDIYKLADVFGCHRLDIFEPLPFGPRVLSAAERIGGLAEPEQTRLLNAIEALTPKPEPPEPAAEEAAPPPASAPAAQTELSPGEAPPASSYPRHNASGPPIPSGKFRNAKRKRLRPVSK